MAATHGILESDCSATLVRHQTCLFDQTVDSTSSWRMTKHGVGCVCARRESGRGRASRGSSYFFAVELAPQPIAAAAAAAAAASVVPELWGSSFSRCAGIEFMRRSGGGFNLTVLWPGAEGRRRDVVDAKSREGEVHNTSREPRRYPARRRSAAACRRRALRRHPSPPPRGGCVPPETTIV